MPRRKLDDRIPALIQRAVVNNHRSLFVLVGDRANDSIPLLHYLLTQSRVAARPNVLWCYKSELGFTTHAKRRAAKIKRDKDGHQTPFELFINVTDIRYTYYKDTHSILGQTYGMLILQDFEALTPNLLARTIETVQGAGIVILTLRTMSSLRQLYSLSMDAHSKYRSAFSNQANEDSDTTARFNERFLLSLGACHDCLLLDDELNVLPLSRAKDISHSTGNDKGKARPTQEQAELQSLKAEVGQTQVVGEIIKHAKTLDQARAVLSIIDILGASPSSSSASTVSLTAPRGRGKSATLGLALSAAIAHGYANIYVTSPSPSNLGTLFDFFLRGLKELGYDEVADLDIFRGVPEGLGGENGAAPAGPSAGEGFAKSRQVVLRVSVNRSHSSSSASSSHGAAGGAAHRQVVQYIAPNSPAARGILASQAELLVIDEAAAIPLPTLNDLLDSAGSSPSSSKSTSGGASGNYMVWLSSTTDGYEGTGRGLSLKLVSKLRESGGASAADAALLGSFSAKNRAVQRGAVQANGGAAGGEGLGGATGRRRLPRKLKELTLTTPIRYSAGDPIESWLYQLLCLPSTDLSPSTPATLPPSLKSPPHPSECDLFLVNRDALFSFHPASEAFLQSMMNLYTSSHYKNSPNDLQLMADAPAQRLFVLLPRSPSAAGGGGVPEPLAVLQVALEGKLARASVLNALARGTRGEAGDLIPWTLSQQFQDPEFASQLSGARIVRIAVRQECARMGYGKRCVAALQDFYARAWEQGADGSAPGEKGQNKAREQQQDGAASSTLQSESIAIRSGAALPPLLQRLSSSSSSSSQQQQQQHQPEKLDWIGVSYGMTPLLLRFWNRAGFVPLYVRQTPNEITGEYSAVQIRSVVRPGTGKGDQAATAWLSAFASDFQRRFVQLLGFRFREWDAVTALTVLENVMGAQPSSVQKQEGTEGGALTRAELRVHLTPFDMKRLEGYANGNVDFGIIVDLLPALASLYFASSPNSSTPKLYALDDLAPGATSTATQRATPLKLSAIQSVLLLGMGAQRKEPADLGAELDLPVAQVLALFSKAVRRIVSCLRDVERRVVESELLSTTTASNGAAEGKVLNKAITGGSAPGTETTHDVERELAHAGARSLEEDESARAERAKAQTQLLDAMELGQYAIDSSAGAEEGGGRDWAEAERQVDALIRESADGGGRKMSSIVSVRNTGASASPSQGGGGGKKEGRKDGGKRKGGGSSGGGGGGGKKARR
ncbi:hypothetical protein V8E36_005318 [Tilletia maclaganii]